MGWLEEPGESRCHQGSAAAAGVVTGLEWATGQAYTEPAASAPTLWTHLDNKIEKLSQMSSPCGEDRRLVT